MWPCSYSALTRPNAKRSSPGSTTSSATRSTSSGSSRVGTIPPDLYVFAIAGPSPASFPRSLRLDGSPAKAGLDRCLGRLVRVDALDADDVAHAGMGDGAP